MIITYLHSVGIDDEDGLNVGTDVGIVIGLDVGLGVGCVKFTLTEVDDPMMLVAMTLTL